MLFYVSPWNDLMYRKSSIDKLKETESQRYQTWRHEATHSAHKIEITTTKHSLKIASSTIITLSNIILSSNV